jgi:hypothetical protein
MAAQERTEYHWIENRIVETHAFRPRGTKQWRYGKAKTLIATIEGVDRSFYLRDGPMATPERIVDCVRLYKGVFVDVATEDFARRIPVTVRNELRTKLNERIHTITEQWNTFAEEPDITGHLKGELPKVTVDRDGWRITINAWTYKRNPKEKEIGADFGVIFDVVYEGHRLVKAAWYQGKIVRVVDGPLEDIPDLADQVEKMSQHSSEVYSLLYSSVQIVAFRGMDLGDMQSFTENLIDGCICARGDRNPAFVAKTVDTTQTLTFFITGSPPQ